MGVEGARNVDGWIVWKSVIIMVSRRWGGAVSAARAAYPPIPALPPYSRIPVRQARDALVAALLDGRSAGSVVRAVYCDVLDEAQRNLKDCIRRFDGAVMVRTPHPLRIPLPRSSILSLWSLLLSQWAA